MKATLELNKSQTEIHIKFKYDDSKINTFKPRTFPFYNYWGEIFNLLKKNKWSIYQKPDYANGGQFKSLAQSNKNGRTKVNGEDFFFNAELTRTGIHIKFYQEKVKEPGRNNSGEHNFNAEKYFSYLMKKKVLNTFFFLKKSFRNRVSPVIKKEITDSFLYITNNHNTRSFDNKLIDIRHKEIVMTEYDFKNNSKCADGIIKCGDIVYYYNWHGRLCKGEAYHHINNMWWIFPNNKSYDNISTFDIHLSPKGLKRTKKRDRMPEEIKKRFELINSLNEKQLKSALRKLKCKKNKSYQHAYTAKQA